MKTTKLIQGALFAFVLAAFSLVGCEKSDDYAIGAPDDLQNRIDSVANISVRAQEIADSIAAADSLAMEARLIEDIYQVGVTDNSTAWWSSFSKYYRLETNADTVYLKFKNFTSGNHVWNNWLGAITSDDVRQGDNGYVEYCIWRADNYSNYAWGTENGTGWNTANDGDTHSEWQTSNYSTMATEDEDFTDYANYMNGADCVAQVTRGGDTVYVDVKMYALSGKKLTKSFYIVEKGIEDQPVRFFMFSEGGHLVMYKTLTTPMDVYAPEADLDPNWNSGSVESIEEEEESSSNTYRADVTATITTTGGTVYTLTHFIEGLTYGGYSTFLVADNSHYVIDNTATYYSALADKDNSAYWYYPYSEETILGNEDNTSGWWSAFSEYTTVVGEAYFHYKFVNYVGTSNWNTWCLYLTNGQMRGSSNYVECFGLRADAWDNVGGSDVAANITNNYNWDNFLTDMNGATVEIEVIVSEEGSESTSSLKSAKSGMALKPGVTIQ